MAAMALSIILGNNRCPTSNDVNTFQSKPSPGIKYAAAFWYRHAQTALHDCAYPRLEELIDRLLAEQDTDIYTNWLSVWNPDSSVRVQGNTGFPSPLYYASLLDFQSSVAKMLKNKVMMSEEWRLRNALVASAVCSHWEITEDVLVAAAGNSGVGDKIMGVIIEASGEVTLAEEVVEKAAANWAVGHKVLALLVKSLDEELITELVMMKAADNWGVGDEVISLLKDNYDNLPVTSNVVRIAARNTECRERILRLLEHSH